MVCRQKPFDVGKLLHLHPSVGFSLARFPEGNQELTLLFDWKVLDFFQGDLLFGLLLRLLDFGQASMDVRLCRHDWSHVIDGACGCSIAETLAFESLV